MKKNRLYTVNKFNRSAFLPIKGREENLYGFGSGFKNALGNIHFGGLEGLGEALGQGIGRIFGVEPDNDYGFSTSSYINGFRGNGNIKSNKGADIVDSEIEKDTEITDFSSTDDGSSMAAYGGYITPKKGNRFAEGGATGGGSGILGSLSGSMGGSIGSAIGGAIGGAISNGYTSGVGNVMNTVGKIASVIPGPWGAAISGGLQILGGGVNALFGTKVDQAKLNAANKGTNALKSFKSGATSFDKIKGITAQANVQDAYSAGVFRKSWAEERNAELKRQRAEATSFANRSIANNVSNLAGDQISNAMANFSAFGGPLEYDYMRDLLLTKKRNAEKDDIMKNPFANTPNAMYHAFGGDLQTNGADFPTGLTHIDAGGSHEESPYDGVQMGVDPEGVPNLVEEGETVYNDYVFSNRILADEDTKRLFRLPKKKDTTFADISKKLEKEIAERPNDPISKAGFKAQMQQLEEQQERQKQEMEAEKAKAAFEALSPEEQTALMQRAAQEEQMAQQAAEQQAIAEQQNAQLTPEEAAVAQGQMTPEEIAMAQQQADGSEAMVGHEPQVMAEGGNLFPWGGITELFNVTPPYAASNTTGFIPYTRDLTEDEVLKREEDPIFQAWTKYVNDNWDTEEVQNYLKQLDTATGGNHLFDKEGKILPKAKEYFNHARTGNHKWGYYHLTPTQVAEAEKVTAELQEVNPDVPTPRSRKATLTEVSTDASGIKPDDSAVRKDATPTTKAAVKEAAKEGEEAGKKYAPKYQHTMFGIEDAGPLVALGMQAMGIGKPDTSGIDHAVTTAYSSPALADYKPIGDYMVYKPFDRLFYANQLNGQSLATQRALMNTNSPSKAANLLAHAYNTMLANGQLYRQGEEFNRDQYAKTKEFNRGTNIFNAQGYNQNQQFNADAINRARQFGTSMEMQGAIEKMDADRWWASNMYGNIDNIFAGFGAHNKENRTHNMIADMAANGVFGNLTPDSWIARNFLQYLNAEGGDLKKKKNKKRGLTI